MDDMNSTQAFVMGGTGSALSSCAATYQLGWWVQSIQPVCTISNSKENVVQAQTANATAYPVLISIADPWQVVAGGLVEIMELLRRLQLPPFLLS